MPHQEEQVQGLGMRAQDIMGQFASREAELHAAVNKCMDMGGMLGKAVKFEEQEA